VNSRIHKGLICNCLCSLGIRGSVRVTLVSLLVGTLSVSAQNSTIDATIKVDASRVENRVSPRMYAAFVEMMAEDVKWGLTAEMVHDRSFEEKSDYLGLPTGWQLEPDTRNDNVGAIRFESTTEDAYPKLSSIDNTPQHSLRITMSKGDITDTRRGLSQGHLSIIAGKRYEGYVWIKVPEKNAYTGAITAALEEDNTDGNSYALTTLPIRKNTHTWQQMRFSLVAAKTDRFAKLTFLFPGNGTLYLDQVSLEPASAQYEVRADSEAVIAKLHPSFIRWPGGNVAQDYHWQWGVGPRDLRPVWTNKAWSNAPEPNDLGTDEYLALCERLHVEPSITVNVNGNGATPEEAAAWVEYANGPATSKYGALRAANGHPAPYGVKQWELGNEIFGDWVRGHTTAEAYAHAAVLYAQAMRGVDPTIKLIAVGEGIIPDRDHWNSAVLHAAGSTIDFISIHDYTSLSQNTTYPNARAQMMARPAEFEEGYRHTAELIAQLAPGRKISQIVNEWNLFYDASIIQSMDGAVYASRMMNGFERDGDFVEANCISDLLNGWVGGIIQASRDRIYGSAQFWAVKMYSDHLGTERLHTETTSPELHPGVPTVDAIATRSADALRLYIKMSNADRTRAIRTHVELKDLQVRPNAEMTILTSAKPGERNSFEAQDAVKPKSSPLECLKKCNFTLPPDSVVVLSLQPLSKQR
jgi:alpha-N-arabinofuranosidase